MGTRSFEYGSDVLAEQWRHRPTIRTVELEQDLVVEPAGTDFCGAVTQWNTTTVTLEDRHGRQRVFPLVTAGFELEGELVTLIAPTSYGHKPVRITASGSVAVDNVQARVAKASRIYVEGVHDAELVERVWGDDLRVEGIVVEPLHGIDDLPKVIADFQPSPGRRLGVLVDHLVPGSKESRIVAECHHRDVLVTGHPYVDIWQAVKPARLGLTSWPIIPPGTDWKTAMCAELGFAEPGDGWRRIRAVVRSYADLEPPLLAAVEELIDFVTVD